MKRHMFVVLLLLLVLSAPLSGQERDSIPPVLAPGDTLAPQKAAVLLKLCLTVTENQKSIKKYFVQ